MKLLIFLLFVSFETLGQTFHYDVIASGHTRQNVGIQQLDSLSSDCGYFVVNDTIVINYRDGQPKMVYNIKMKVLDLDCKCYYYFSDYQDVIVVNDKSSYIVTAFLTPEIVYTTTFYLKPSKFD